METVVLAVLCVIVGVIAGWFIGRTRQEREIGQLRERLDLAASGAMSPELTEQSRRSLEEAVSPLAASLERYQDHLDDVERARRDAYSQLRVQLSGVAEISQEVREETGRLAGALRSPNARGLWGEVQLKRLAESAGMVEYCDFDTQVTVSGVRPDLVVRLADDRSIVVDAKAPMDAYLASVEAEDGKERDRLLARHAQHLRTHVKTLASRSYPTSVAGSADFTVLFVPSDQVLDAALRSDPTLLEEAFSQDVVVASPGSLLVILKTAALTWRQVRLAEHAQTVHRLGGELLARMGTVVEHLTRLGGSLEGAVQSYNQTVASVESRLLVTARRFRELEVSGEDVGRPSAVETPVRLPASRGEED
ncbi:DNA recombination protein RmuC [Haloglycomyces albus]|uniref:DNA recombination protein RmuC n=1 Tax=Haloglycomyces albus TaxID=526067 RepID=UPI00046D5C1E|nr:DNA recombination protein RmuC [Haloglycomyces albus]